MVAFAGLELLAEFDDDDASSARSRGDVLGSPWDKLVILAIVTSAMASTQTTIIPASRTTLSMARTEALPRRFAADPPALPDADVSTVVIGALAIAWYVAVNIALGELPLRHALGARR